MVPPYTPGTWHPRPALPTEYYQVPYAVALDGRERLKPNPARLIVVIRRELLAAAMGEAAAEGHSRVRHALEPSSVGALIDEAAGIAFLTSPRQVGRVQQSGVFAKVDPTDSRTPVLATLAYAVRDGLRDSQFGGADAFFPNEAIYQRYVLGDQGISPHRDQSFYKIAVVIFNLVGRARFTVLHDEVESPRAEWMTEPGDMYVLAGDLGKEGVRRPRHSVGRPCLGTRVSLSLRMNERIASKAQCGPSQFSASQLLTDLS